MNEYKWSLVLFIIIVLSCDLVNSAPGGMLAFFKLSECPDGWIEHKESQGRLIHSVTNSSHVNLTLGTPLSDLTPPSHSHNATGTVSLSAKSITYLGGATSLASSGSKSYSIQFLSTSPNYPFIHLLLCRLVNDTQLGVPSGLIAFFDSDTCPPNWNPYTESIGRFIIPGSSEDGVVISTASPLNSLEDRKHNHQYTSSFTTNTRGCLGGGNAGPAKSTTYQVTGTSTSSSSNFPYIQLLTCRSSEDGSGGDLPLGIHMFFGNGYCTDLESKLWQDAHTNVTGRWIISLPENGTVATPFGGTPWEVTSTSGRDGVPHGHYFTGSVSVSTGSKPVIDGGEAFAWGGEYGVSGASTGDTGLPYLSVPMCELVGVLPSSSPVPVKSTDGGFKLTTTYIAIIAAVGAFLVATMLVLVVVVRMRKKRHPQQNDDFENKSNYSVQLSAIYTDSTTTVSNIQIKEKLGGGNFGDVFKGLWNGTTFVALKKLKSREQLQEFAQEAKVLLSLNHPNIVRCLGIHTSSVGDQYIVMEYLSKGSLDSVLKKENNIKIGDLLIMAKHAAAGMLYLEQQHIVHRDLALRNLLVAHDEGSKYTVKVSDFGLSRKIQEEGYYMKLDTQGIPIRWTAPEVFEKGIYTTKSDVWSFGITLWELFSFGQVPYAAMTNFEVMQKVVEGFRLGCPKDCPEDVHGLMVRCWQQFPENRPGFKEIYDVIEAISKDYYKQTLQWSNDDQLPPPLPPRKPQQEIYQNNNNNDSAVYF